MVHPFHNKMPAQTAGSNPEAPLFAEPGIFINLRQGSDQSVIAITFTRRQFVRKSAVPALFLFVLAETPVR
jgi:hypothetical protein